MGICGVCVCVPCDELLPTNIIRQWVAKDYVKIYVYVKTGWLENRASELPHTLLSPPSHSGWRWMALRFYGEYIFSWLFSVFGVLFSFLSVVRVWFKFSCSLVHTFIVFVLFTIRPVCNVCACLCRACKSITTNFSVLYSQWFSLTRKLTLSDDDEISDTATTMHHQPIQCFIIPICLFTFSST